MQFIDDNFHQIIQTVSNEILDEGLTDYFINKWQRKFIQFIDKKYGSVSEVLSIKQPWVEFWINIFWN